MNFLRIFSFSSVGQLLEALFRVRHFSGDTTASLRTTSHVCLVFVLYCSCMISHTFHHVSRISSAVVLRRFSRFIGNGRDPHSTMALRSAGTPNRCMLSFLICGLRHRFAVGGDHHRADENVHASHAGPIVVLSETTDTKRSACVHSQWQPLPEHTYNFSVPWDSSLMIICFLSGHLSTS